MWALCRKLKIYFWQLVLLAICAKTWNPLNKQHCLEEEDKILPLNNGSAGETSMHAGTSIDFVQSSRCILRMRSDACEVVHEEHM